MEALPLMEDEGKYFEVLGFNQSQRAAFLQVLMRFGFGEFDWAEFVPRLKQKTYEDIRDYGELFFSHLAEDHNDSPIFSDGVPKDGLRVQDVLIRITVLSLIRDKVKYATEKPEEPLFADDILSCYPTLKGGGMWKGEHDLVLLRAVMKHGYGRWQDILDDKELRIQEVICQELNSSMINLASLGGNQIQVGSTMANAGQSGDLLRDTVRQNDIAVIGAPGGTDSGTLLNQFRELQLRQVEFIKNRVLLLEKRLNAEDQKIFHGNEKSDGFCLNEPGKANKGTDVATTSVMDAAVGLLNKLSCTEVPKFKWRYPGFVKLLLQSFIALQVLFVVIVDGSDSTCSNDTALAGFQSEFVMLQHQLRGVFSVVDNCSFRVSEFDMLPGSDQVHWWGAVGDNFVNLTNGFAISDDTLNKTYKNDSFVVHLRSNLSWDQIKVVAVWDSPTASDFGHVLIPDGLESSAPAPAPESYDNSSSNSNSSSIVKNLDHEQPTMFENCKVLSSNYRLRWTLREEDNVIDIGLEAVTGTQNYMAFGWANTNLSSTYMLHADVTVSGFTEEGLPFAEDYYISDYSECTVDENQVARGVCPDSLYSGSDSANNTLLVYGHRKDGVSFVRYQRPLQANDPKADIPVNYNDNATVIWALGRIKPPDSLRPYSLPQNHGGPRFETYGYLSLNVSEHVNDCLGPLDADDKEDQELVIADANTPLVVSSGPAMHYPNPPNPSKVLYINKKEAPLLRVERGVPVKFSVQAGHDVAFYITSDPLGGNATLRNVSETIFAGGVEYEGVPASPKELVWTPHRNTPDRVFYQSAYEQKMGWKVQVVDGGLSDMYNNSVLLDDQQVSFFWTLSENSISVAARGEKKSGYLAIGFGSEMVHSFAYVGWFDDDGKGQVDTYWIDGKGASDVHPTKENLTYVRCKSENGIITMEFTRPFHPSCPKDKEKNPECNNLVDPSSPLKVIWAMGAKWSSDNLTEKNMHSAHSSRYVKVMLSHGSAETEQDLRPVLTVHGFMMFLAWGILLPGGILAARYLKHLKGDGWYQIHVYLQYSGLVIVLLGFLFAVAELKGLYVTSAHVKLGLTAIILACAQPINALLRPKKPGHGEPASPRRIIWEYSHVIVGRSAIIIGMAALLTGMKHLGERYGEDVRRLTWALICWFLLGGVAILFLEYRDKHAGDRSSGRGNWVLGNEEDDSADLLSPNGTYAEKEAYFSDTMEIQLEPLGR